MMEKQVPADYSEMDMKRARKFDEEVRKNFMPAIMSTVKQIVEDYNVKNGICVEVGCGTALFAIELCKNSNLKIFALEKEKAIYEVAKENIEKENLTDRIKLVLGDAHNLPFSDNFADFVISRGAYHCWEDKAKVFAEVNRVLKIGGLAIVGGGFGKYVSKEELERMKNLRDKSLGKAAQFYYSPEIMKKELIKAGINNFNIQYDETGLWVEIKK